MTKSAAIKKVLEAATKELGTKESPANSNNVKYNTKYYGSPVNGSQFAWCVVFIWYLFNVSVSALKAYFFDGKKTAWCPGVVEWAKKKKIFKSTGAVGALALFDWDGDGVANHIGIVEKVLSSTQFQTIEGNTAVGNDSNGGQVMRRTRNKSSIMGFVYWFDLMDGESQETSTSASASTSSPSASESKEKDKGVLTFQQYLNKSFKAKLSEDNSMGPKTKKAGVKAWQSTANKELAAKLVIDGDFGPKSSAVATKANIKKGSKGTFVALCQGFLLCYGYYDGAISGTCDAATAKAIGKFQAAKGLEKDKICGSKTWKALLS